jgi:hypothetical protein
MKHCLICWYFFLNLSCPFDMVDWSSVVHLTWLIDRVLCIVFEWIDLVLSNWFKYHTLPSLRSDKRKMVLGTYNFMYLYVIGWNDYRRSNEPGELRCSPSWRWCGCHLYWCALQPLYMLLPRVAPPKRPHACCCRRCGRCRWHDGCWAARLRPGRDLTEPGALRRPARCAALWRPAGPLSWWGPWADLPVTCGE